MLVLLRLKVRLSGNGIAYMCEVCLSQAQLALRWVTACIVLPWYLNQPVRPT